MAILIICILVFLAMWSANIRRYNNPRTRGDYKFIERTDNATRYINSGRKLKPEDNPASLFYKGRR